jgi:pyridoxamine 5'-phosphate oxidase
MPSDSPLHRNPVQQFQRWFRQARKDPRLDLPEAMCLSTITAGGGPSARMVLLKGVDRRGFNFFTNIDSPKAEDLLARPRAALTFHWRSQRRQIRIEGKVVRLPKSAADAYFATRPRDSQIGSWASRQSQPLESRAKLLEAFHQWERRYQGKKVPAPPHWQGFRLEPARVEFWQERPYRLHDRWLYVKQRDGWKITRLSP